MVLARMGGLLNVNLDNVDGEGVRLRRATFVAMPGSITSPVEISMTAFYGSTLQDIGVQFTPSGQKFNPPAFLTLVISGKDLDLTQMKAYHIEGSTVTEIIVQVFPLGENLWALVIQVPGFSIYSLGDGLLPPPPPEAGP